MIQCWYMLKTCHCSPNKCFYFGWYSMQSDTNWSMLAPKWPAGGRHRVKAEMNPTAGCQGTCYVPRHLLGLLTCLGAHPGGEVLGCPGSPSSILQVQPLGGYQTEGWSSCTSYAILIKFHLHVPCNAQRHKSATIVPTLGHLSVLNVFWWLFSTGNPLDTQFATERVVGA